MGQHKYEISVERVNTAHSADSIEPTCIQKTLSPRPTTEPSTHMYLYKGGWRHPERPAYIHVRPRLVHIVGSVRAAR